jgi:hypothetical protein
MKHKFVQKVVGEKQTKVDPPPERIISLPEAPKKPKDPPQESKPETIPEVVTKSRVETQKEPRVYTLRDVYTGRRILMKHIGIDVGTKNIVLAIKGGDGDPIFLREINGYYIYPNPTNFIRNMLSDDNKVRSDGTKRPARFIEFEDRKGLYVLGQDAQELAYSANDTLLRPMAHGGIAQDEDAMMVLASIVQGLLDMAENEVGKFTDQVHVTYCTTAKAVNADITNIDYHKQVIDLIIEGHETDAEITSSSIKESHAIVLKESPDGTGIGISWGAGTVTVSYCKWGTEVYSFCYVGAGDWIDLEVAKRHGYDPNNPRKKSKETPTTVCKEKESIDLSGGHPTGRLGFDIFAHYTQLINTVIDGIVTGFVDNEDQARIDGAINIYMAGGTSSPNGFCELVQKLLGEAEVPFDVADVNRCDNPLFSVAEGCLIAAETEAQ